MQRLTLRYGRVSKRDWVSPPRAAPRCAPYSGLSLGTRGGRREHWQRCSTQLALVGPMGRRFIVGIYEVQAES